MRGILPPRTSSQKGGGAGRSYQRESGTRATLYGKCSKTAALGEQLAIKSECCSWKSLPNSALLAKAISARGEIMADRYCRNCGHELGETDRFCPNCGSPVHEVAQVPTPEADVPVPTPPEEALHHKSPERVHPRRVEHASWFYSAVAPSLWLCCLEAWCRH